MAVEMRERSWEALPSAWTLVAGIVGRFDGVGDGGTARRGGGSKGEGRMERRGEPRLGFPKAMLSSILGDGEVVCGERTRVNHASRNVTRKNVP